MSGLMKDELWCEMYAHPCKQLQEQKLTVTRKEKEGMIKMFDSMCLFLANHGWTERDERAVNIRKLIDGVEVEK